MTATAEPVMLRTEREVAADAVISLFEEGLLALNDPLVVARAARASGLTPSDLRDAHRRWLTGRWRPPAALPVADPSPPVPGDTVVDRLVAAAEPVASYGTGTYATRGRIRDSGRRLTADTPRQDGEPAEKVCGGCGLTKPITEYLVKKHYRRNGRGPGSGSHRHKLCHQCRREDSRSRYLTVAMRDRVNGLASLELLDGDALLGHACTACGTAFDVGDLVDVAVAWPRHHACPVVEETP